MSRAVISSRFRVERLCNVNISGSANSSFHKRPFKPGQHGKNERIAKKRVSDYGSQLNDLRIFSAFYGNLNFGLILKYARNAMSTKGDMVQNFAQQFELNLISAIYWLKWAPTPGAARQMLSHGKSIKLNGKKVNRGYIKAGDKIELTEAGMRSQIFAEGQRIPTRQVPGYYECEGNTAILKHAPSLSEIQYPFVARPSSALKLCRTHVKKISKVKRSAK